ncbi:MAG: STAS domain-containing protein [Negativicutes bacterium]|nr:STAS domain-containing protein [Negativicutes bacterium]
MSLKVVEIEGVVTVIPSCEIRDDEAIRLEEAAMEFIEKGRYRFLVDLSNVKYLDSAGLGVLIKIRKKVQSQGGDIAIRGLNGIVKELFEMTSLDQLFTIV